MSVTEVRGDASSSAKEKKVDLKLEVVVIPVSDVGRAKEFCSKLGWRLDADFPFDNGIRIVQLTPPGSGSSVQFGSKITSAAPSSAQEYLIFSDIEADQLAARCRGKRSLLRRHAGRSVPARRHERSRYWPCTQPRQLPLLRDVYRPGRQRLAPAGDHDTAARPDRRR